MGIIIARYDPHRIKDPDIFSINGMMSTNTKYKIVLNNSDYHYQLPIFPTQPFLLFRKQSSTLSRASVAIIPHSLTGSPCNSIRPPESAAIVRGGLYLRSFFLSPDPPRRVHCTKLTANE
jgi:hypothetical protein